MGNANGLLFCVKGRGIEFWNTFCEKNCAVLSDLDLHYHETNVCNFWGILREKAEKKLKAALWS